MKFICILTVSLALVSFTMLNKLTGTWQGHSEARGTFRLTFTPDNTYQLYINEQPRMSGVYTLTDSIFTIEDNGCPEAVGKYKVTFFGKDEDSCRFQLIEDACEGRAQSADNTVLFRIK